MSKSWKLIKTLLDENIPQSFSDSDSEKNVKKHSESDSSPSKTFSYAKSGMDNKIPDYFTADKLENKILTDLEYKLDPSLPFIQMSNKQDYDIDTESFDY